MSRDKQTLEEIKSYDDSYWLRYLAENTIFDTENIKAQKDWLINQLTAAKEEIARINCDYYADKQRFHDRGRELEESKAREQKLREAIETAINEKAACGDPGNALDVVTRYLADTLASLYPKEETK